MTSLVAQTVKASAYNVGDPGSIPGLGRLLSHLDCKEIQPVNPKGNQTWIFIGKTDAEAETAIFGHLMWLIGKDPDAGKDWRQEEKGMR